MTEEQTQETTEEQTQETQETQEVEKTYTKADVDKIRNSFGQQMKEVQGKLSSYERQKAQEEEAKALEKGEHDKVISNLKEQLAARDNEMTTYQQKIRTQEIDSKLLSSGIKNDFARKGIIAELNGMEEQPDIGEYVSSLKESMPTLFEDTAQHRGKSSGSVGLPTQNNEGLPLSERLKSDDPKVVRSALKEQMKKRLTGQPVD